MSARQLFAALALAILPRVALAQHGPAAAPPAQTPPREATQFDFMVGQWELVVKPLATSLAARIHGAPRLSGTWKAWRALDGWGIEDELRITDASGNPRAFSHAVRVYDATARRWNVSLLDVYRGAFTTSTADWRDGAMLTASQSTDADGKRYLVRTRYYDVTPTGFRYQQDRSADDGRTWTEGVLRIEARRVAATAPR
jgi:hypothetical protein